MTLVAEERVPFGFKIALKGILRAHVLKYGEAIGKVSLPIKRVIRVFYSTRKVEEN